MQIAISWTFLTYFIILFAERMRSLIHIAGSGEAFFSLGFSGYVNLLTILSLVATVILLAWFNSGFWRSLFHKGETVNVTMLSVTAGVILLSGMVHTDYTIPVVQFVAYGVLIIGLFLQTILTAKTGRSTFTLWYSLIYLVAFSMAIPVMYHSSIQHATLFHVLEAVASAALVAMFTFMLMRVMTGQGNNLLLWAPFLTMLVSDAVLIAMRWKESINVFVLLFASLSTVLFIAGKILFAITQSKQ